MNNIVRNFCLAIFMACFASASAYTTADYISAMNRGDYSQAINVMTSLIKNATNKNGDYYYKRACAYEKKGNYVYAVVDCGTALNYSPTNQEYFLLRARCKQKLDDPTYIADAHNAGSAGLALLGQSTNSTPQLATTTTQPVRRKSTSDVDINIPQSSIKNANTFVLIFGIENYIESDISNVDFALNDGAKFREYCLRTLGIPEQNIHYRSDATRNQLRSEIKWARNISEAYGKDANLIVYYSGHGMPDERTRRAYLLPADGIANDPESGYALSSLYEELGEMNFNSSLVLLDACFSGTKRNGEMLTASKGVAIKPSNEELFGNVAVLSATQGDDTAYPDEENGHGLFTYYLLKKLQESKGNVTIAELSDYISTNVKRASVVRNAKMQTPTVNYSSESSINLGNVNLKTR